MEDTAIGVENTLASAPDPELEAMMKAGVHLGHAKSKDHASMKRFIFGVRNTVSVIDLVQTRAALARAESFITDRVAQGGFILLVGTRPAARGIITQIAEVSRMPSFTERWIGGTLTNFKVIRKRLEHLEMLEKEKVSGAFEKYTKKERMMREEEIARLKKMFDGLRTLTRLPDAVFVVDTTEDTTAVREARRMKIPIVALCDTNADTNLIDYPIPSNDDALSSVHFMVHRIGAAIEEGMRLRQQKAAENPAASPAA
jgi:small subunit ribosomal protein S2